MEYSFRAWYDPAPWVRSLVASLLAFAGLGVGPAGGVDEEAIRTDAALVVAAANLAEQLVPDPATGPAKDETPQPEKERPAPREKTALEKRIETGRALIFRKADCVLCDRLQRQVLERLVPQGWLAGTTDGVDFQTVDAADRQDLVRRYGVAKVPTVILVRGDRELGRRVGFLDADDLANWLNRERAKVDVEPKVSYGHCPKCGAPGVSREKTLFASNDTCQNGHIYPTKDAKP